MADRSFNYVECDVPEGQTLRAWHQARVAARRRHRRLAWWRRSLRRGTS